MNRYLFSSNFPMPIRKILPAPTDILHELKIGERLDNLAYKYYDDATIAWVIMYGNPEFDNELEIQPGDMIRIPFPLQRVFNGWKISDEL